MASWTGDVVGGLDALASLERPWRELAERAAARPFQSFAWHAAWLATLGAASGHRPHLAVLREGERLLGVLPLARRSHRGLRLLEWSGHGMTDYNDVLLDPEIDAGAALPALWRTALARGADIARLTHLPPGSPVDAFLTARSVRTTPGETTWAVPLAGVDADAWLAGLSAGLRRNFHRYTRKLEEAGVSLWVWSPAEPAAPFLEALVAQKRSWFREAGQSSFLDGPAGPAFLRAAAEGMAGRGGLHLAALRAGDRFVACMLSFVGHRTLYAYTVSRDQAWNRFGPGQILFMQLIRWCCENGFDRADLLGGDQDFKPRLGCRPTLLRCHLLPCSLAGWAALAAWRAAGAWTGRAPMAAKASGPVVPGQG